MIYQTWLQCTKDGVTRSRFTLHVGWTKEGERQCYARHCRSSGGAWCFHDGLVSCLLCSHRQTRRTTACEGCTSAIVLSLVGRGYILGISCLLHLHKIPPFCTTPGPNGKGLHTSWLNSFRRRGRNDVTQENRRTSPLQVSRFYITFILTCFQRTLILICLSPSTTYISDSCTIRYFYIFMFGTAYILQGLAGSSHGENDGRSWSAIPGQQDAAASSDGGMIR